MSDSHRYEDDLISAYLDGETDPADAARIESDPRARARAAELAAARAAVAEPVPPLAPAERDRLRAAALDAAAAAPAAVRSISAARRPRRGAFIPVAAAAGIAAVVLGVMAVLLRLDDGREDMTAASPAPQSASDDTAGDASADDMPAADEAEMAVTAEDGDSAAYDESEMADMADDAMAPTTEPPDNAMASAAPTTEMYPAPEAEEPAESLETDDGPVDPGPIDLGPVSSLEQLIDRLALRIAAGDDFIGPYTESGPCAEAVAERVAELGADVISEARAELNAGPEAAVGGAVDLAVVTTGGDEGPFVVYAAEPACGTEVAALK